MFYDLVMLGFTVNKTKTVSLPNIPKKYFSDYLRGYFDGDGCVSFGRYKCKDRKSKKFYLLVRFICHNKKFLQQLSEVIRRIMKTNGKTIFRHTRSYALAYSILDSLKIMRHFYQDKSGIWMDRKYRSCQKVLKLYYGNVA